MQRKKVLRIVIVKRGQTDKHYLRIREIRHLTENLSRENVQFHYLICQPRESCSSEP